MIADHSEQTHSAEPAAKAESEESRTTGLILALDPGSRKCGLALLEADGSVVQKEVLPPAELLQCVKQLLSTNIQQVVLGAGTTSKALATTLQPICQAQGLPFVIFEETRSTELARLLYFRENPPRGWRRLIPLSFQSPPCPYDDYGAVVIGRHYLQKKQGPP